MTPVPCGVGMYSDPGQESCSVCLAGFYCGSNETSYVDMLTGAGSWDLASSSAGMCFNGTYCAAGMIRAPGDTEFLLGLRAGIGRPFKRDTYIDSEKGTVR